MMRVLSLGAGVQSTTLALMAARGEIGPPLDAAIFADTMAEPAEVYAHLSRLQQPGVLPFPIHIVSRGNLADDGLMIRRSGRSGFCYQKNLIPLFIKNPDGSKGILHRKCTSEYKVREIVKEVRRMVGAPALAEWRRSDRTVPLVEQWIGISTDEAQRMKPSRVPWIVNRYPLIERNISRRGCLAWLEANEHPPAPRSACVFCPYHNDREWRRLKDEHPDDFAKAVQWERLAQEASRRDEVTRGELFLHASLQPLSTVDFSTADEKSGQVSLFGNECEGMCGV